MAIDIPCPHCEVRKIETVRSAWFVRGFLLFAQWGSNKYIGCGSCTRNKVLTSLAITSAIGWWCFPWGLGVPVVLLQNIASAVSGPDRPALQAFLLQQGIDIEQVEVQPDGRTEGHRQVVTAVLTVLHRIVWADGRADAREIEVGTGVAVRMLGDKVSPEAIGLTLNSPEAPDQLDVGSLHPDSRLIIMKSAVEVAAADDVVEESEVSALRALATELDINRSLVDTMISSLTANGHSTQEHQALRAVAADVLGVSASASATDIQARYRATLLSATGVADETEASEAAERAKWAYDTLMS